MSAKTMAEVLRAHWSASTHTERKPFVDKCDGCGAVIFSWGDPTVKDGSAQLAAHQAEALSAAGFGLVADAKAEALEEAAAVMDKSAEALLIMWDAMPMSDAASVTLNAIRHEARRVRARAATIRTTP